ncbi:serine hydroxymethyltransferase [Mollicutes bacterium LVI A0039]|nr:serine hydroxymethyltransferase [Mollicutes bacterium LVI A0039]
MKTDNRPAIPFTNNSYQILEQDQEVLAILQKEHHRLNTNIELIASENVVSEAVLMSAGSILTNKYAEGYPGKRYYGGCQFVDQVEQLAIERAKALFGAEHANVQAHCGTTANIAVYSALLEPGDTVLAMDLNCGGHLSHGSKVSLSGKLYNFVHYGIDPETELIDFVEVEALAKAHKPKIILAGYSNYSRIIDFERFSNIAKKYNAILMVDMAHIAGLIAAGVHPSPVPYADVITSTTHKTLRGPRGGLILSTNEYAAKIDKAVFPANQGGPLMHIIAAKAVAFGEALKPEFKQYQQQVVKNAKVLSDEFIKLGYEVVGKGTDNHLLTLKLVNQQITGDKLEKLLDSCNITVNKNSIPFDPLPPSQTSGIRIGTPAVTTRGFGAEEMREIARCIDLLITDPEKNQSYVQSQVAAICNKYPLLG